MRSTSNKLCFALLAVLSAALTGFPFSAEPAEENLILEQERLYRFLTSVESKKTGLYQSFTNSAHSVEDIHAEPPVFMRTLAGYLDNQAFTYDQSLAIIALLHMKEDAKARHLLSVFSDNFETEINGRTGLLNSYSTSNFDYFIPTSAGKANLLCMGVDGDRMHAGPNAWMALAALHYFSRTGSPEFLPLALRVFKWLSNLNRYEMPDGSPGAISMGYGWGARWQHVFSTENNIDYYALANSLIKIHAASEKDIRSLYEAEGVSISLLRAERHSVLRWLKEVAFKPDGTFSRGSNPVMDIDLTEALDCSTWAIPVLGIEEMEKMGADPVALTQNVENIFSVKISVDSREFTGLDFTDAKGFGDKRHQRTIWWEGTAQMALVYRLLADHYEKKEDAGQAQIFREKHRFYIGELDRFMALVRQKGQYGLPYTAHTINENEVVYTFFDWWPLVRPEKGKYAISLASTLWRYFAVAGVDPFDITMPEKTLPMNTGLASSGSDDPSEDQQKRIPSFSQNLILSEDTVTAEEHML